MDSPQATQEYAAQATRLAAGGSAAVVGYVYSLPADERLAAARAVQRSLYALAGEGAGLDLYVETLRELIDRGVAPLVQAGSDDENDRVLNSYNALSYNFAADLADCWPGDTVPREQRHFEAGLRAAEDCVRWRNELNKPPKSFSLAYWAKGYHLLALGHASGAVKSFNMSLGFALRDAQDNNKLAALGAGSTFDVLLTTGYLGIAELAESSPSGQCRYDEALDLFREQLRLSEASGDADVKQNAEIGIGQLEIAKAKYAP
jgi:hypothetical protein